MNTQSPHMYIEVRILKILAIKWFLKKSKKSISNNDKISIISIIVVSQFPLEPPQELNFPF